MKEVDQPISRRDLLRGAGMVLALPFLHQAVPENALAGTPTPAASAEPESGEAIYRGRWHDKRCYFGFHHDLHVIPSDRDIGTHCTPEELVPMLRLTGADFVQTDSKGHTGLTSWFSKTPNASVGPGVVQDALAGWRAATRKLGLPLHAHYSGIYDVSAGTKHPQWCIRTASGQPLGAGFMGMTSPNGDRMCPRSRYADELMIPQLLELIDRYGVDGFWVDGDLWAMEPCYCNRCRTAFRQKTASPSLPRAPATRTGPPGGSFTRQSFDQYVTRYCDAVHRHKPGVLVCSNWLQTLHDPGEPKAPTDWISGDNSAVWGLDNCRCEARFISTRGKPWDIMMWCFYSSHGEFGRTDWAMKPVEMLQQEAADHRGPGRQRADLRVSLRRNPHRPTDSLAAQTRRPTGRLRQAASQALPGRGNDPANRRAAFGASRPGHGPRRKPAGEHRRRAGAGGGVQPAGMSLWRGRAGRMGANAPACAVSAGRRARADFPVGQDGPGLEGVRPERRQTARRAAPRRSIVSAASSSAPKAADW